MFARDLSTCKIFNVFDLSDPSDVLNALDVKKFTLQNYGINFVGTPNMLTFTKANTLKCFCPSKRPKECLQYKPVGTMSDTFDPFKFFIQIITRLMESLIELGYWGLFIGSFLASTIIPMSADVLLIGILSLGGNVWLCLAIATVGNWIGGLTSYWIGWVGRWEWIERWLKVKEEQLLRQKVRIDRYGAWLALLTWLPLIGDLFAIALGFYKIRPYASAIYMLIGRFARFLVWTLLYIKYADSFIEFIS